MKKSNIINFDIKESSIIKGVFIFTPSNFSDERGILYSSYYKDIFKPYLPHNIFFKHDKFSYNKNNVLRGIHGDSKSWKLVTCVFGKIFQVIVDRREGSHTYNKWESFILTHFTPKLILLPPNIGNSFYVMSKEAVYHYKLAYDGEYIDADEQFSIKWNDSEIGIKWPTHKPLLSERDK